MPTATLRILIIDRNRLRASVIEDGLREAGHMEVQRVSDMTGLMRRVAEVDPDVIIMDLENPNRDMLEHALQVSRAAGRPVAMFVDSSDAGMTEAAMEAGVSAYVVGGLQKERVQPVIDLAISRFRALDRMRRELEDAKTQLAERKVIDRAKGILMRSRGFNEEEAWQMLRRTAMNQNRRVGQVAESLVIAADMLGGGEET